MPLPSFSKHCANLVNGSQQHAGGLFQDELEEEMSTSEDFEDLRRLYVGDVDLPECW